MFVVVELSSHQVCRVMCVLCVAILERKTLACPCIAFLRKKQTDYVALEPKDDDIGSHHRVCCRHLPEGDTKSHTPQLNLGKRFAAPKKRWTDQAQRAKRRETARNLFDEESHSKTSAKKNIIRVYISQ